MKFPQFRNYRGYRGKFNRRFTRLSKKGDFLQYIKKNEISEINYSLNLKKYMESLEFTDVFNKRAQ